MPDLTVMSQTKITFIINKIPYALTATDVEAIKKMPSADRQQLVALLEAVKREENTAHPSAITSASSPATPAAASPQQPVKQAVDPDALMARLAIEDRVNNDPELVKQKVYKWAAGITVGIFVLIFIS